MLTSEQEIYILTHAYVPEHIVVLMTSLSGGEPFLIDDYFCCCKDNWVVFIGYPLQLLVHVLAEVGQQTALLPGDPAGVYIGRPRSGPSRI